MESIAFRTLKIASLAASETPCDPESKSGPKPQAQEITVSLVNSDTTVLRSSPHHKKRIVMLNDPSFFDIFSIINTNATYRKALLPFFFAERTRIFETSREVVRKTDRDRLRVRIEGS